MITDHLDFLYSECSEMVSSEKKKDLKNLYTILKPIPDALKTLVQTFMEHIRNEGTQMISTLKGETVLGKKNVVNFLSQTNMRFDFTDSRAIRRRNAAGSRKI